MDWVVRHTHLGWTAWFYFMLPFSLIGTILMGYNWWRTRGQTVTGG
jgi:hypothetical protein